MGEPITVRFHASLYPPASVRTAAEAFARLASVEVAEEGERVVVTLTDVAERARDRIADELCNHALFQAIVDLRQRGGGLGGV